MKDASTVYVIFLAFALLSIAGDMALLVGNISLVTYLLFEACFCIPIFLSLGALAYVWEEMEHETQTPIRVHSFQRGE